ncbi:hypothetical protein P7C70_g2706, partial [Phenoliferia sp. Uapishka_3]
MKSLQAYTHVIWCPVSNLVIDALKSAPNLNSVRISSHAIDSLPALNRLGSLEGIYFDPIAGENLPDLLPYAPLTVGIASRRNGGSPSLEEFKNAMIGGLSKLLIKSQAHLQHLHLGWGPQVTWLGDLVRELKHGQGSTTFPALRRLRISFGGGSVSDSGEMMSFVELAPQLERVVFEVFEGEFRGKLALPTDMNALKFFQLSGTSSSCDSTSAFRNVIGSRYIEDINMNSISLRCLRAIFAVNGLRCTTLTRLHFALSPKETGLKLVHIKLVLAACPNLEDLQFITAFSGWEVSMVDVIKALSMGATKLRVFGFDHPWEEPERGQRLIQDPDGRTIRSDEYGNFRLLAVGVHGESVAEEVVGRIKADIKACTPLYTKRFEQFATACPNLEKVLWVATLEVQWVFEFLRWPGETMKVSQESFVTYAGPPWDDAPGVDEQGGRGIVMRSTPFDRF